MAGNNSGSRKLRKQYIQMAVDAGCDEAWLEKGKKHPKLCGRVDGKLFKITVSLSPGDFRVHRNVERDVKRRVAETRERGLLSKHDWL